MQKKYYYFYSEAMKVMSIIMLTQYRIYVYMLSKMKHYLNELLNCALNQIVQKCFKMHFHCSFERVSYSIDLIMTNVAKLDKQVYLILFQ